MVNALTDPKGALSGFPPNTMDADGTTHADAQEQTYANLQPGGTANDIQPGLKPGNGWTPRPFAPAPDES